jgi:hypothetical protein
MSSNKRVTIIDPTRRRFLQQSFVGAGWVMAGGMLTRCSDGGSTPMSNLGALGPLQDPDENGIRLPVGFTSRVIAKSGEPVGDSGYQWHSAPDGGAVFTTDDGGWIYVSNSETFAQLGAGASAVRFSADGEIVDAYSILSGTDLNCAGGPTPWGTWLSCEEKSDGRVWECDPLGITDAVVRPALGVFEHEAAAIDPSSQLTYLTEDIVDGGFYRFVPDSMVDGHADLSAGELQIAQVIGDGPTGMVEWLTVPDPSASSTPTSQQVASSTPFNGGEGMWYHQGIVYFSTKGDDRIWAYEISRSMLTIIYDAATSETPILTGVDNLTVSPTGDVVVAEDMGDMQIVAITPDGTLAPLLQVTGQDESELAGPGFGPSFDRLYFSSGRGPSGFIAGTNGITYEVSGPFYT